MTKKKKAKRWSKAEKIELYRQYLIYGREWSKFAYLFDTSPKSISKTFDRVDWDFFLEENNLDIDELSVGSASEDTAEDRAESLIQIRKNRIKKEAEARRLKQHIEKIATRDIIFDKIVAAIEKVPPITFPEIIVPKKIYKTGPQEGFLLFGDCHIGLAVSEEEVGGLGRYNIDIFQDRVNNLVNTVSEITELHRSQHEMKRLNICMMGDIVHGSNDAGKWGFIHTEQNIMDQVFLAADVIPRAILKLRQEYDEIRIFCVHGNHGRVGKRGVEKQFVNWDYLLYHNMQTALSNQSGIEFFIPKANFNIAEAMGHKFLLIHGDNVRCFTPDSLVGLSNGTFKKIKDIKIEDEVISHDGSFNKVSDIHEYEHNGKMIEINADMVPNPSLKCTLNHEIPVVFKSEVNYYKDHINEEDENYSPEIKWVKAECVSKDDFLCVPKPKMLFTGEDEIDSSKYIKEKINKTYNKKIMPEKLSIDKNLGLILGQYLADGNCAGKVSKKSKSKHCTVECVFNSDEKSFWEDYISAWEKVFNDTPKLINRKDMTIRAQRVSAYSSECASLIGELCGHGAYNKTLHSDILNWNEKALLWLLIGYLRGDGHTARRKFSKIMTHRVVASTMSLSLGQQLFWISIKCGFMPSLKFRKRSGKKEAFLTFFGDDARFLGPLTQRNYTPEDDKNVKKIYRGSCIDIGKNILVRVNKVKLFDYVGKKYDLSVQNKETYTVNCVSVHNSWNGVPWYGLTRMESRYRSVLSRNKKEVDIWKALNDNGIDPNTDPEEAIKFIASFTRPFDFMIAGHFHTLGEVETSSGGRIILNSSFIGGDQYSINDLVVSNSPSQKFFGVNKHRKTWTYDIDLDKK